MFYLLSSVQRSYDLRRVLSFIHELLNDESGVVLHKLVWNSLDLLYVNRNEQASTNNTASVYGEKEKVTSDQVDLLSFIHNYFSPLVIRVRSTDEDKRYTHTQSR